MNCPNNMIDKIKNYLKETQAEVKKVAWPGQKYVVSATIIILALTLIIGFFVSFLDLAFAKIIMTLSRSRVF